MRLLPVKLQTILILAFLALCGCSEQKDSFPLVAISYAPCRSISESKWEGLFVKRIYLYTKDDAYQDIVKEAWIEKIDEQREGLKEGKFILVIVLKEDVDDEVFTSFFYLTKPNGELRGHSFSTGSVRHCDFLESSDITGRRLSFQKSNINILTSFEIRDSPPPGQEEGWWFWWKLGHLLAAGFAFPQAKATMVTGGA